MTLRSFLTALGVAVCVGGAALAQTAPASAPAVTAGAGHARPSAAPPALTRTDLEPWLDGVMNYALSVGDVAGVSVAVVKDGQVLLQKGYGYADVATKTPVDPSNTLFRIGSVSKLFTWTAVMQLVEQHKIDLDRDINDYLDFKIPPRFGKPITMRELMQHTPGFEDHAKFMVVDSLSHELSIEQFLKRTIPARIFPPGETPAYSNYGATLAGYIVQRVSGQPFDQYVEDHIFGPLGMVHTTFHQPVPAALAPDVSKGYVLASEGPQKFEIVNAAAAGAASSTAADMARFMLAHLGDGRLGSVQILQPATAELMHRQSFQATPPLPGFALGFYHEDRNGHDVIAHEGDTNYFKSNLELILDQHVGVFIAVNSFGKDGAGQTIRNAVYDELVDRYFPAPQTGTEPTWRDAKTDGTLIAGDYDISRRMQTTLPDVFYILGQLKISMAPDGTLTVPGITTFGGATKHWREIAPFLWRDTEGHDRMAAKVENGVVKAIWFDETVPAFVLQPVTAGRNKDWIMPVLGLSLLILAVAVIAWPLSAVIRWRYKGHFAHAGLRGAAYRLVRLSALAELIFILGLLVNLFTTLTSKTVPLDGANDAVFHFFQVFGLLGLAGVLVGVWNLIETWRDGNSSWWAKATAVLVVLALACASGLAIALHFFSLSLTY